MLLSPSAELISFRVNKRLKKKLDFLRNLGMQTGEIGSLALKLLFSILDLGFSIDDVKLFTRISFDLRYEPMDENAFSVFEQVWEELREILVNIRQSLYKFVLDNHRLGYHDLNFHIFGPRYREEVKRIEKSSRASW